MLRPMLGAWGPLLWTLLVLALTIAIGIADVVLPQDIETDFLYTLPVLLSMASGRRWLPYLVAGMAVVWTPTVDLYLAGAPSQMQMIYATINDVFGMISVLALAAFVARRMRQEGDLSSIIHFLDGRLRPDDTVRLHRMLEMTRMMALDDHREPPSSPETRRDM